MKFREEQDPIRQKLEDLIQSLTLENSPWSEWEEEFIDSLSKYLKYNEIRLTERQEAKVQLLWDKL